mmetsp:Transcript_5599/g.7255  ORF Transcript_5599/g.7255 Transcript_5599/m.7255 type:complete len:405 (-) Transcript_5599:15-1229(-)
MRNMNEVQEENLLAYVRKNFPQKIWSYYEKEFGKVEWLTILRSFCFSSRKVAVFNKHWQAYTDDPFQTLCDSIQATLLPITICDSFDAELRFSVTEGTGFPAPHSSLITILAREGDYIDTLDFFGFYAQHNSKFLRELSSPEKELIPSPCCDNSQTPAYYLMDPSSLAPILALGIEPHYDVLDMCAAPGGKSLAICQKLDSRGSLTANEYDPIRCQRLKRTINAHINHPMREKVLITCRDASRWQAASKYDRILLDVPCSFERHLIRQLLGEKNTLNIKKLIQKWAMKWDILPRTQYSILFRALQCLRPGGRLVYSTCSVSTKENDDVIKKFLRVSSSFDVRVLTGKEGKLVKNEAEHESFCFAEAFNTNTTELTEYGVVFFPHQNALNCGPMYISVIELLPCQ